VKKISYLSRFLAGLLLAASVCGPLHSPAMAESGAGGANAMPPKWDARIPLPKGAVLVSSTEPKSGVVYSADFTAPGTYKELVDFYETELPKAGFKMGPKVAVAARKVYNRTFTYTDILDSVVISPSSADPSKLTIHVAYTPPPK